MDAFETHPAGYTRGPVRGMIVPTQHRRQLMDAAKENRELKKRLEALEAKIAGTSTDDADEGNV